MTMVLAHLAISALVLIARAFVFSLLWAWLIVPVFGLPHINIVESISLLVFVGFLKQKAKKVKATKFPDLITEPIGKAGTLGAALTVNQNIGSWNTAAVTNMSDAFRSCTLFNGNISGWNVAAVTNGRIVSRFI